MIADDYRMSDQLQASTLAILVIVVAVMVADIWALAVECHDRWSIEDAQADMDELADDYWLGRDLHAEDVRDAMRAARKAS